MQKNNLMFVANWKMEFNFDEELNFATSNYDEFIELSKNHTIILSPSFLNLHSLSQIFETTKIETCAQNCSQHSQGPFTGQIPAESLHLCGSKYCIIGHSEARKEFKETNHDIAKKFEQLINYKISPIICIGEKLEDFKNQKTLDVLEEQLQEILNTIKTNHKILSYLTICIAYEPIWSIGTDKIPSNDHLESIFAWLNKKRNDMSNLANFKFLYGGSVSSKTIDSFKKVNSLEGFLIGRASLDFAEFKKMVESNSNWGC